jgi:glutaredoxin-related protein
MKRHAVIKLAFHLALLISVLLVSFPLHLAHAESRDEQDEPTCKLDTPSNDCTAQNPDKVSSDGVAAVAESNTNSNQRILVTLTDENFDELTWTPYPATWLIMFKTDACGICKKALPEFEKLAVDPELIQHNENEVASLKDFVYQQQQPEEGKVPKGPVYIGLMDANWDGRDTTKRFNIDATPTIIIVRNEGYDDDMDDTRTYTTYKGQRAQYALKNHVLSGGYMYRSKSSIPPPLSSRESKPTTLYGRLFEICKPYFMWVGKLLATWFIFIGIIGLFMRVHNYAWNDNDQDDDHQARDKAKKKKEEEIEREFAQGKREYKIDQSKEAEERQRKMLQRKLENRAKFAAKKEERKKKVQPIDGVLEDDDDDFVAVGVAVKKSDIQKGNAKVGTAAAGKSKSN